MAARQLLSYLSSPSNVAAVRQCSWSNGPSVSLLRGGINMETLRARRHLYTSVSIIVITINNNYAYNYNISVTIVSCAVGEI